MARIRPATRGDLAALAALESSVFAAEAYPPFFFRQALDLWPEWLRVAEVEGAIAGSILAAPALERYEACILSLAVSPTHRGGGTGRALLDDLLAALRAHDVALVWLTVHPENAARRLYERAGFRAAATEESYFGPGEPRVRMERRLR